MKSSNTLQDNNYNTIIRDKCPLCFHIKAGLHKSIRKNDFTFYIVKCSECGFVFVENVKEQDFNREETDKVKSYLHPRNAQIMKIVQNYTPQHQREKLNIVEVGAGFGCFPEFLENKKYNYIGFEPSVARARECANKGFNVINDFFRPKLLEDKADIIIMDNVIEHAVNPKELLDQASKCLIQGGILILIVPNLYDIRQLSEKWRERHHWQPTCHINYFSAGLLKKVMRECGLSPSFFGFSKLTLPGHSSFILKTLLDKIGINIFGLYMIGLKR